MQEEWRSALDRQAFRGPGHEGVVNGGALSCLGGASTCSGRIQLIQLKHPAPMKSRVGWLLPSEFAWFI